jgi:hypothetical protein
MKTIAKITRRLIPLFVVLVVSSLIFLPSVKGASVPITVKGASAPITVASSIPPTLSIQTGTKYNGYLENSNWSLKNGTGTRTFRTWVPFYSPFQAPPAVSVSLYGQDVEGVKNNRLVLAAENVTKTGFTLVYTTWYDTVVNSVWASWIAIGPR